MRVAHNVDGDCPETSGMPSSSDGTFASLDQTDVARIQQLCRADRWIGEGDVVTHCRAAGQGNMNVTLRVNTDRGSLILKQGMPWVARYPSISAPIGRTAIELAFYQRIGRIAGVAERMPRVLGFDAASNVLALEDLGDLRDLSAVYRGVQLPEEALKELASYLAALHSGTRDRVAEFPSNLAMRRLNHEHIFVVPLNADNGLDLDKYEAGLRAASVAVIDDPHVRARFTALGDRYLSVGRCLIHGDFFPGSWVETDPGVRVIDPEFGFAGTPEFDVGVALGHLTIGDCSGHMARRWLAAARTAYGATSCLKLNWPLILEFAAVEIIRRLIGVAQLPIPATTGRRAELLSAARATLHHPAAESLHP